jgi:hypothetical protein
MTFVESETHTFCSSPRKHIRISLEEELMNPRSTAASVPPALTSSSLLWCGTVYALHAFVLHSVCAGIHQIGLPQSSPLTYLVLICTCGDIVFAICSCHLLYNFHSNTIPLCILTTLSPSDLYLCQMGLGFRV